MAQNHNRNSRRFPKILYLFGVIAILVAVFPWLYEIKTKAGIDISRKRHAGSFFEKHTHGLVKCEWLYPYYCNSSIK